MKHPYPTNGSSQIQTKTSARRRRRRRGVRQSVLVIYKFRRGHDLLEDPQEGHLLRQRTWNPNELSRKKLLSPEPQPQPQVRPQAQTKYQPANPKHSRNTPNPNPLQQREPIHHPAPLPIASSSHRAVSSISSRASKTTFLALRRWCWGGTKRRRLTMRCLILGGKCMLQGCGERERTSSSFTGSLGSIDSAMMVLSLYLLCSA